MRTLLLALILLTGLRSRATADSPVAIWPQQVPPIDPTALGARTGVVQSAASGLPASLAPAVQFQVIFLRILSGENPSAWRGEIEKLATLPDQSPLGAAVRDLSRVWLARAEMVDIDAVLRNYYRHNIRFPSVFAEVEADVPETLRKDPWGDPWFYQPRAPLGFERLTSQRYQLAPGRFPQLAGLASATHDRTLPVQPWQITLRDVAGNQALEIHSTSDNTAGALLQPGGRIDNCTLLFIGDHWALMAGVDQLFAVPF